MILSILTHTFPMESDRFFKTIVNRFASEGNTALSSVIGRAIASETKTDIEISLFKSNTTGFSQVDVAISEVFVCKDGLAILELNNSQNRPVGSLFGAPLAALSAPRFFTMTVTVISSNVENCDRLLCKISDCHFAVVGGLFPANWSDSDRPFIESSKLVFQAVLSNLRGSVRFDWAVYDDLEARLSEELRDVAFRSFSIRFAQLRALDQRQVKSEFGALISGEDIKSFLAENFLTHVETVVECKKTSNKLANIEGSLDRKLAAQLKCPHCSRTYNDERLAPYLVMGKKYKKMLEKSHWLSVEVTKSLNNMGIPNDFIAWNVRFGADEIDIVAYIDNSIWIFELKDDEFSYNHAQIFNHRRLLIGHAVSVIVTTKHVSSDAKDVFIASENRGSSLLSGGGQAQPVYIEGFDKISVELQKIIAYHREFNARWHLRRGVQGVDDALSEILAASYI